jgi:hypothetical protein
VFDTNTDGILVPCCSLATPFFDCGVGERISSLRRWLISLVVGRDSVGNRFGSPPVVSLLTQRPAVVWVSCN